MGFTYFRTLLSKIKERIEFHQAIKTALAAIISLYICMEVSNLIPRPGIFMSGLWCVVSAIVVLQPLIGGTYKAILNRFLGVLIGSLIGALFAYFWGANSLVLGIALFTTIILCSLLNLKDSFRIAALSVAVMIIPWSLNPELSPWSFAFFRFLDTCLGILVAVVITHTIWPSQAETIINQNISQILNLLNKLFQSVFILTTTSDEKKHQMEHDLCKEISSLIMQTRLTLDESKMERIFGAYPTSSWSEMITTTEKIFNQINDIRQVYIQKLKDILDEPLLQQVNITESKIEQSFKFLSDHINNGLESNMNDIDTIIINLNNQLVRFRETRAIRVYSFEFVEKYFVFFHGLKTILIEQLHLCEQIDSLHSKN